MHKENRRLHLEKIPFGYGYSWKVTARHIPSIMLSAGTEDTIRFFREGDSTYALSVNSRRGYIGLQELVEDGVTVFFQNAVDELRPDIFDLADISIAKILLEYIS